MIKRDLRDPRGSIATIDADGDLSKRFLENNFNLKGLNKLDSIEKYKLLGRNKGSAMPIEAANKFYDKHPACALDKIR